MNFFRRLSFLLIGTTVLLAASLQGQADLESQPVRLTLREAFDRARSANLNVLISEQTVDSTRFEAMRERASLLPAVDFSASQTRAQQALLGALAEIGDGEQNGVPRRFRSNQFSAKVGATVPLLRADDIARYSAAKITTEVAEYDFATNVQDIYEITAVAYFTHLRNLARLDVIQANIARDEVLLDLATNRFEAGVATPIDVTRAEVALAGDERELLQQETAVEASRLDLLTLLNMDLDLRLALQDDPVDEVLVGSLSIDDLPFILESRPDYKAATRTLERNRTASRAAALQRLPDVALFGEWGYAAEEAFDGEEEEEWLVGISVDVPIFEGFRIRADRLQADALVRQQEYVVDQVEQGIAAEYRLTVQTLRSRFREIAIAERTVELSQRELDLARTRFEQGVADNRDVVEAQANLAAANDLLVQTLYRYNLARVDYARVRGDVRYLLTQ